MMWKVCIVYILIVHLFSATDAQVEVTSSLGSRTRYCFEETVTYTCRGVGVVFDWFLPPLFDESSNFGIAFRGINVVGDNITLPQVQGVVASLTQKSGGFNLESTLTIEPFVGADMDGVMVVCRSRNLTDMDQNSMPRQREVADNSTDPSRRINMTTSFDCGNEMCSINIELENPAVKTYDIKDYTATCTDENGVSETSSSSSPSLNIGVNGQRGSRVFVSVGVVTMCNQVIAQPPVPMHTDHSSSTYAVLTVPVIVVFVAGAVGIIVLAIILGVVAKKSKITPHASKENIQMQ